MNKYVLALVYFVNVAFVSAASAQTTCPPGQICTPSGSCNDQGVQVSGTDYCRQHGEQPVPPIPTPPTPPRPEVQVGALTHCIEYLQEGDIECPEDNPECWRTIRATGGRPTSDPLIRSGWNASCECLQPDHLSDLTEATVDVVTREGVVHRTQVKYYVCIDPRRAVQFEREIDERIDDLIDQYNDLAERVERLERACGERGMSTAHPDLPDNAEWTELCESVGEIPGMLTDIRSLRTTIDGIDEQVQRLRNVVVPGIARGACGIGPTELAQLTQDQIAERCSGHRERSSLANLQVGAGFRGIAHTETGVFSAYAVANVQWEPMVSQDVGIYVRGRIGYGTLGDQPGHYGTVPVGESGLWGLSGGVALRLDPRVTLNVGVGFDSSLVEGMRGRVGGTYRWHTFGPEARIRIEPIDHFYIEAEVGVTWGRGRVQEPNDGELRDLDGVAIPIGIGIGFRL